MTITSKLQHVNKGPPEAANENRPRVNLVEFQHVLEIPWPAE